MHINGRQHTLLRLLCIGVIMGMFVIGLWPFNFIMQNKAGHIPAQSLIFFRPFSIIFSNPFNTSTLFKEKQFTIHMVIRPETEPINNIRRIVTLFNTDMNREIFFCGQWETHLVLRYLSYDNKMHEINVDNVFFRRRTQFLTITSSPLGIGLYINGRIMRTSSAPFPFSLPPGTMQVLLGNAAAGNVPWEGAVRNFTVLREALNAGQVEAVFGLWKQNRDISGNHKIVPISFVTQESQFLSKDTSNNAALFLYIPKHFTILKREILAMPDKDDILFISDRMDKIINILGFFPLGFFAALFLSEGWAASRKELYFLTGVAGFIISLFIELLQIQLPTRSSSFLDLFLNSIGALLGAILLHLSFACSTASNLFRKKQE